MIFVVPNEIISYFGDRVQSLRTHYPFKKMRTPYFEGTTQHSAKIPFTLWGHNQGNWYTVKKTCVTES